MKQLFKLFLNKNITKNILHILFLKTKNWDIGLQRTFSLHLEAILQLFWDYLKPFCNCFWKNVGKTLQKRFLETVSTKPFGNCFCKRWKNVAKTFFRNGFHETVLQPFKNVLNGCNTVSPRRGVHLQKYTQMLSSLKLLYLNSS